MSDEKNVLLPKSGIERLVDASIKFRTAERRLHLRLEDRVSQLAQWAVGPMAPTEEGRLDELGTVIRLLSQEVVPLLAQLQTLRGEGDKALMAMLEERDR